VSSEAASGDSDSAPGGFQVGSGSAPGGSGELRIDSGRVPIGFRVGSGWVPVDSVSGNSGSTPGKSRGWRRVGSGSAPGELRVGSGLTPGRYRVP
jgi:hypothetical protein